MRPVDRITLRKWRQRRWRDAQADLVNLGRLYGRLLGKGIQAAVDDLRVHELRKYVEQRQAALFAYFIEHSVLKCPIAYAMSEEQDYDCLIWWNVDGKSRYAPVQLKELVPSHINPTANIVDELAKLAKYVTSDRTIIAVHLNQAGLVEYSSIPRPATSAAEIWLYAAISPDQSLWFLYGDLLHGARGYEIPWPTQLRPEK
jgi:hypothetical protein